MRDAQDQSDDNVRTSFPIDSSFHTATTAISTTLSTIQYDKPIEQRSNRPLMETISIPSYDVSRHKQEKEAEQQQQQVNIFSRNWSPPAPIATSTSSLATTTGDNNASTYRSRTELENHLFQNIGNVVQEFIHQTKHGYPYYRVMRWTICNELWR